MSKREKWFMGFFIIVAVLFLLLIPVKIAYPQEAHVGAQVVFKVDSHRDSIGRRMVEPQGVRIVYVISPVEKDYPVPFGDNDLVMCRPYNEGSKYFLQCGGHRYMVNTISLIPRKEEISNDDE